MHRILVVVPEKPLSPRPIPQVPPSRPAAWGIDVPFPFLVIGVTLAVFGGFVLGLVAHSASDSAARSAMGRAGPPNDPWTGPSDPWSDSSDPEPAGAGDPIRP